MTCTWTRLSWQPSTWTSTKSASGPSLTPATPTRMARSPPPSGACASGGRVSTLGRLQIQWADIHPFGPCRRAPPGACIASQQRSGLATSCALVHQYSPSLSPSCCHSPPVACNSHCKELETALLLADSSVILQLAQIGLVREAAKQKPRLLHNFKTVARG